MDLSPYLEALRRDLAASAAPAGEAAVQSAELLAGALDSAARLCLLEALSDAAAEITTKLDHNTVEVRLRGRDAELVVADGVPAGAEPPPVAAPPPVPEGGDVTRITLRLPEPLKEHVERAAVEAGLSVNAWLIRAVSAALAGPAGGPGAGGWPPFPPVPPGSWTPGGPFAGPPPGPGPHPGHHQQPSGRGRGRRMTGYAQA